MGIPDIRLYEVRNDSNKPSLKGQYVTSGPRTIDGFSYWLHKYTKAERGKYPLLIPRPLLHKQVHRNRDYYEQNYEHFNPYSFDADNTTFQFDQVIQASAILEDSMIASISAVLSFVYVFVTLVQWIKACLERCKR